MKNIHKTIANGLLIAETRAGLKGKGARGNFHCRAPMTYFMTSYFVKITFSFTFSGSRECTYSILHTVNCENRV